MRKNKTQARFELEFCFLIFIAFCKISNEVGCGDYYADNYEYTEHTDAHIFKVI